MLGEGEKSVRETLAHFFVLFFLCRHQNTVIMAARSRAPLASAASASSSSNGGELTVEQFLNQQMVEITNDVQKHAQQLIARLKAEYLEGAQEVRALMSSSSSQAAKEEKKLCVLLKCVAGAHIGQKFMLEPATSSGEDVFKMGRLKFASEASPDIYDVRSLPLLPLKVCSLAHAALNSSFA